MSFQKIVQVRKGFAEAADVQRYIEDLRISWRGSDYDLHPN
jgi:hypothetical protein